MSEIVQSTLGACVILRGERADPRAEPEGIYIGLDSIEPHSMSVTRPHTCKEFESSGVRAQEGDILYGRLRPYLNKVTVAKSKAIASGEFIVLEARTGILPDYLCYAMHSREFVQYACRQTTGDRPRVKFEQITAYTIPVPSLPEQRAIVAKIEALFSELERGCASLEAARARLKTYRRAVLKAAFEAVPDSAPLDAWGEVTGGLTKNSKRIDMPFAKKYLRVANVYFARLDLSEVDTIGLTETEYKRTKLEPGDLLFVEGNGSKDQIGRVAVWNGEIAECVHQNHIIKLRPRDRTSAKYLMHYFCSQAGRKSIVETASSTSGLYTLSICKIEKLKAPLADETVQSRIVADIESRLSLADALGKSIDGALVREAALRQAILKKAFEGRLLTESERSDCRSETEVPGNETTQDAAQAKPSRARKKK